MIKLNSSTILLIAFLGSPTVWGRDPFIDSPMFSDPKLKLPAVVHSFPSGLIPLWKKAVQQPEEQLQRRVCLAIARAKALGMRGLDELAPLVVKHLDSPNRSVRLAAATALLQLKYVASYDKVLTLSAADGLDAASVIEPRLMEQGFKPLQDHWRKQLSRSGISRPQRLLAVRGLGQLGDESVAAELHRLATDRGGSISIRLAAARALGRLAVKPKINFDAWVESKSRFDRLTLAARIHVADADAVAQLTRLSLDTSPAVALEALHKLASIDKKHLVPLSDKLSQSPDAGVRRHAVEGLRLASKIGLLAKMMNDPHPDVRRGSRDALLDRAGQGGQKAAVVSAARTSLAREEWRAKEQSALIIGYLDDKESHPNLVDLLDHKRPEVYIASAWALRKLAVPSTLPALHKRVKVITAGWLKVSTYESFRLDDQLIQIFQAFAAMKYAEARETLITYTNKQGMQPKDRQRHYNVRASAIYALSKILEGKPEDPEVVNLFIARIKDTAGMPPEGEIVHRFCTLGLGRMKIKRAVRQMEGLFDSQEHNFLRVAAGWTLEQLTSKKYSPKPSIQSHSDWFIVPSGIKQPAASRR